MIFKEKVTKKQYFIYRDNQFQNIISCSYSGNNYGVELSFLNGKKKYLLLNELKKYYKNIIIIESKYNDDILADYEMLIKSMYLTKYIAANKNKDLSKVDYSPLVKKLYKFNGNI